MLPFKITHMHKALSATTLPLCYSLTTELNLLFLCKQVTLLLCSGYENKPHAMASSTPTLLATLPHFLSVPSSHLTILFT
jgi:hypothetical protein